MLKIIRAVISLFVAVEMIFASLAGGTGIRTDMPEMKTGELTQYVNPFIGTGGIPWACAMLSPAACVPFGCVRVGPDTSAVGGANQIKTNTSGYYYEHRHILGFSMSRLSGTGARDYEMFRVTPVSGQLSGKPAALAFSHRDETASPGYYAVYLPGAAALCARSALRSGAGLVTVACPASIVPVVQTLAPCAMAVPLPEAEGAISAS